MKGIFSTIQEVAAPNRRLMVIWEQVRTLTAPEILWCLFAGLLVRGTLFGVFRPFGLAFYTAYSKNVTVKILMCITIFFTGFISGDFIIALMHLAAILLFELSKKMLQKNETEISVMKNASLMGIATFITGVFVFLIMGQTLEAFMMAVMEAILIGSVAFLFTQALKFQDTITQEHTGRENMRFLGILTMGGAFLLAISGIRLFGFFLDRTVAGVSLLFMAKYFGPGFGACAGAIAGMSLSSDMPGAFPALTGMYTIAGLTTGLLQNAKIAAGIGYIVTGLLFMLVSLEINMVWTELFIPVALFLFLPGLKAGKRIVLKNLVEGGRSEPQEINRIRTMISIKLSEISQALYKLAHTAEKQINTHPEEEMENRDRTIEQLTVQVCNLCSKASTCWEAKLFQTYKVIGELVVCLQDANIPFCHEYERELNRFCVKSSLVVDTLMRMIEIKRIEKVWKEAIQENRRVIPEQIYGLSEIISGISGEVFDNMEFFDEEEKRIAAALRKKNYPVVQVEVLRSRPGRFQVQIRMNHCEGFKNCQKDVQKIVNTVLGIAMHMDEEQCKGSGREECVLLFREKENLGVTTGIARYKKGKACVSGDAFTFLKTRGGKYIVAISDGMGSGKDANRLSETAIGLFEQLLDCGMSIRLSLGLINRMIQINGAEKFATMDISAIDLYTGETEFYKMGAVPSIIMRGKQMDFVQINNLPAGLNQENVIYPIRKKIMDGEFIIMTTDGVYDHFEHEKTTLEKILRNKVTLNPQELAEHILTTAGKEEKESDDMTVLVAKIWRKTG